MKCRRMLKLAFYVLLLQSLVVLYLVLNQNETLPPDDRTSIQNNEEVKQDVFQYRKQNRKPVRLKDHLRRKKINHPPSFKNWLVIDFKGGVLTEEVSEAITLNPKWVVVLYNFPRHYQKSHILKLENVVLFGKDHKHSLEKNLNLDITHWTDKNLVYLYAIVHEAQVVVESTDANIPDLEKFHYGSVFTGIVPKKETPLYNPLPHFGQSCAKLKGFPTDRKNADSNDPKSHEYLLKTVPTPPAQYVIRSSSSDINFDPKDKIQSDDGHPRLIDTTAPPVIAPRGSFTPFHSSISATFPTAFWTLFMPRLNPATDQLVIAKSIWSCIQQKLLSEFNDSVMFVQMKSWTKSMHFYSEQIHDEKNEHLIEKLIVSLKQTSCRGMTSNQCFKSIYGTLSRAGFVTKNGSRAAESWINALEHIDYFSPASSEENKHVNYTSGKAIIYYSKQQNTVVRRGKEICTENKFMQMKINNQTERKVCNRDYAITKSKFSFFKDIMVIMIENKNLVNSTRAVNLMYRHVMPNMVFCSIDTSNTDLVHEMKLSFVPSYRIKDELIQPFRYAVLVSDCVSIVMKMGYDVKGYLITHDDLHLNFWNFNEAFYKKDKVWAIRNFGIADYAARKRVNALGVVIGNIQNWHQITYENATKDSLIEIHAASKDSYLWPCKKNLQKALSRNTMYYYAQIDLFYWPKGLVKQFTEAALPFIKNRVWPEIALPNIMNCVVPYEKQIIIPFGHEYSSKVAVIWKEYKKKLNRPYFHPFKLNSMFDSEDQEKRQLFCNEVLPEIGKHT